MAAVAKILSTRSALVNGLRVRMTSTNGRYIVYHVPNDLAVVTVPTVGDRGIISVEKRYCHGCVSQRPHSKICRSSQDGN